MNSTKVGLHESYFHTYSYQLMIIYVIEEFGAAPHLWETTNFSLFKNELNGYLLKNERYDIIVDVGCSRL